VAGTFGLATASDADAQACVGFGNTAGQLAVGLTTSFPTGGNTFGAEAGYNFAGPLSTFAGFTIDTRGDDDVTGIGGGVAFEVPAIGAMLPGDIQTCPTASIRFVDIDFTDAYNVPVGIGFATTLGLDGALAVSPYVIPQVSFFRGPGVDDTFFMLDAGALVGLGNNFYAGAQINRAFRQGEDSVFGIKIGATF